MNNIVFAITSQGNDFYSAMTRLAVASIRLSNPGFLITVACDSISDNAMRLVSDLLINEVDIWQVINTPIGDSTFRNRFVKTILRNIIEGPFLFLDSDILVRGNLSPIFKIDADIAGARNHSKELFKDQIWVKDQEILDIMDWQVSDKFYINGGVMFYNDSPKAYQFAESWHKKWLEVRNSTNSYRDQPALNASLKEINPKFQILEDKYNAQIKINAAVAWDAVIWHYYSSVNLRIDTSFDDLAVKLSNQNVLQLNKVRSMVKRKYPWRRDYFIDFLIAKKIKRQGNLSGFDQTWLQGNRAKAINLFICNKYFQILKILKCKIRSMKKNNDNYE
jgi:hypothetical protein